VLQGDLAIAKPGRWKGAPAAYSSFNAALFRRFTTATQPDLRQKKPTIVKSTDPSKRIANPNLYELEALEWRFPPGSPYSELSAGRSGQIAQELGPGDRLPVVHEKRCSRCCGLD
jgi:hypothetical protein